MSGIENAFLISLLSPWSGFQMRVLYVWHNVCTTGARATILKGSTHLDAQILLYLFKKKKKSASQPFQKKHICPSPATRTRSICSEGLPWSVQPSFLLQKQLFWFSFKKIFYIRSAFHLYTPIHRKIKTLIGINEALSCMQPQQRQRTKATTCPKCVHD